METWGGYVRSLDIKPVLNRRDIDPNWRGRFSGGSRSARSKAKTPLTQEEMDERAGADPERHTVVETTLMARDAVRGTRARQRKARDARTRELLEADEFK